MLPVVVCFARMIDGDHAYAGIDGDLVAGLNQAREVAIGKAITHRHVGLCRTLRQDWVDVVE